MIKFEKSFRVYVLKEQEKHFSYLCMVEVLKEQFN